MARSFCFNDEALARDDAPVTLGTRPNRYDIRSDRSRLAPARRSDELSGDRKERRHATPDLSPGVVVTITAAFVVLGRGDPAPLAAHGSEEAFAMVTLAPVPGGSLKRVA